MSNPPNPSFGWATIQGERFFGFIDAVGDFVSRNSYNHLMVTSFLSYRDFTVIDLPEDPGVQPKAGEFGWLSGIGISRRYGFVERMPSRALRFFSPGFSPSIVVDAAGITLGYTWEPDHDHSGNGDIF